MKLGQIIFIAGISVIARGTSAFANDISYHCKLVERKAGHHGVVEVHGEGRIDIVELGVPGPSPNPDLSLNGPNNTNALIGSYDVHIPTGDYLGRMGQRKLLLALSEKDPVSGYSIYFQELVLSVDDGTIKKATLHRDLDDTFLRIECKQIDQQNRKGLKNED